MRLHRFHGGLALAGHKAESTRRGLQACPLPPVLRVSLLQHAGLAAESCVAPGERVARGQRIGIATDAFGADVHAPAAGRIAAIEAAPMPGGALAPHVRIEVEAGALADAALPALPDDSRPEALLQRLRDAGLVGLGGAGFPTAEKLSAHRELLVLNGAECEPWIACDDALLREHADEVVRGGRLLARVAGAGRVLLAVEDDMPEAIAASRAAIAAHGGGDIELVVVPTRYPEGGERQLIQVLTGREVPRGGLPRDIGVAVHNVATARAAWRAVALGEPLTCRIVTVTGPGVASPGNFLVPLGTSVAHLVASAGGYTPAARRLLLGGPMMGLALPHDDFPLGKTHQCVLVLDGPEAEDRQPELPCIRCGDCARACPPRLLPQQLHWQVQAGQFERALDHGLFDCIECGCCDLACPSHIPLVERFRQAKAAVREREAGAIRAEDARQRFEHRRQRLEREAAEREARLAARQAAASPDAVAAALERARARRAGADGGDPKP